MQPQFSRFPGSSIHAHPIGPSFDITKGEEKDLRSPLKSPSSSTEDTKSHFTQLSFGCCEKKEAKQTFQFPFLPK
jgi:hypothetical protein